MMRFYFLIAILMGSNSCTSVQPIFNVGPIVDSRGLDLAQYDQDLLECRAIAEQKDLAAEAAIGAVVGGAIGGAVGAAVGNSRTAKRGAGAGAILGGVRGTGKELRERERVVRRCLIGRGYRVLN